MSSLIIIALVMIGFSFFKPLLQEKEAKVVIAVIAHRVLPGVAFPFAMTMGDTWPDVGMVLVRLHTIRTCTVLVIIGRSHSLLSKAAKTDEKAVTLLAKIKRFAWLYVLEMGYLYEVAVFTHLLRMVMAYEYSWVSNAMEEGANLSIFVAALCMFRPINEYTMLDAHDDKEETMW
ncbi:protein CANDIDATE G-PROTEIN COUPLED RECEPTOR 7-like [Rhodamnia argentea]|uniref:Protein CANDIDATE G-PROTEIN COUPLED RECEPTOR 7-like n=1 Tax=Rhodamnia argentea TaxID=178133 RepID=A0ABM3HPP4_9MYRT|nr:protein CANDIDATE G-PROTEIN COUPLED RECEPTOR 7-like [Rhodamnia argentea]